jgi:hypothetical protein
MSYQGTIGSNLLNSYGIYGDLMGLIRNIKYLLVIILVVNLLIDTLVILYSKKAYGNAKTPASVNSALYKQKINIKRRSLISILAISTAIAVIGVFYIVCFNFALREYAFAGYYDFENGKFGDYYTEKNIPVKNSPVFDEYMDVPLCRKIAGTNYYEIIQITVERMTGETETLIPYYDAGMRKYNYIANNVNFNTGKAIGTMDKVVGVSTIVKYRGIALTGAMMSLRLPAGENVTFVNEKPLYLIVPFYFLYLTTMVFIVVVFTVFIYRLILAYAVQKESFVGKILGVFGVIISEFLKFLNSLTLVVVFLIVNLALQKIGARAIENAEFINWQNLTFRESIASYTSIQVIIILMFSIVFIAEIKHHYKSMRDSDEFRYYKIIGMNEKELNYVYNRKYGKYLLGRLVFQNIMFVFNINWFICYVFNQKREFFDTIGVTYSVSFENIFTKTLLNNPGNAGLFDYFFLFTLNLILFTAYMLCKKRLNGGIQ